MAKVIREHLNWKTAKKDHVWQKCRRGFNSLFMILFVLRLVAMLHRVSDQTIRSAMWEQCLDDGIPLPQDNPLAALTACEKPDPQVFKTMH